ncbi:hypothetical protein F5X99DRAFT_419841 [Biscogniauxia marginata]|nr:hypothetical protein F5X99DRAFT_419841 [Biscogniauxia marginata]
MDLKDVSGVDHYCSFFEQTIANTERARRRKGQAPRNHSPNQLTVSWYMAKCAQSIHAWEEEHMISTTHVPAPYPPSVRFADDLQPLMVSQMILEELEDDEGTAVLLQFYNQAEEAEIRANEIVRPQSVDIIKELFFKATTRGWYSLRVDHVSDITQLLDSDRRVLSNWRKPASSHDVDSQKIKILGNRAVQRDNRAEAERMYSSAVRAANSLENEQLAHLIPLKDASMYSQGRRLSKKALFRQAKVSYGLRRFKSCLDKLHILVDSHSENVKASLEMERARQRLREEENGAYWFSEMYKQAKVTPPSIDCTIHAGPIAVHAFFGCGHGLFTSKPDKAVEGQAHLITQIAQNLYHNHDSARLFTDLHHGDYDAMGISKPLASRTNHSCHGNYRRSFINNMQIIRACQDIEVGIKLFFCYQSPSPHTSKTLQRRKALCGDLHWTLKHLGTPAQISKAWMLVEQLENTYPTRERVLCLELWDTCFMLVEALIGQGRPAETIEVTVKGLDAFRYKLIAYPSRNDGIKEQRLVVEQWGQVNEHTVHYLYSIHVNGKETVATISPELA